MPADLRYAVLGPVRAWRGGEEIALGSPQARLTLAALLLAEGRAVGKDQLVDMLWEDEPPRTAISTVRTYISRLRTALGAEAIVSAGDGYAIKDARLDLVRFTALCQAADFDAALGLWQGEALAGLDGAYARNQRARLEELRLTAVEQRMEQAIESGRSGDLIGELSAHCAAHPLRERPRALLMHALYLAGRQAEAIAVYADTQKLLKAELGVAPSADLAGLYQRILTADVAPPPPVPMPAAAARPAQLPADIGDFTGRARQAGEMAASLTPGRTLVVSALAGIGGVGKTTLAVHVAHRVAGDFPDGQLYIDLQGMSPGPVDPAAALGSFLRALGLTDLPDGLADRAALFRSALAGRRMLVLLDNARDTRQILPLLPGAPGCAVVVTSRAKLADLAGATHVALEVLDPGEALELFSRVAGAERVAAERGAALDVVAACGFLPLAVRIAAGRLAARPAWTVASLRDRLADEHDRLAVLKIGDLAVEATFALGYRQLTPAEARAFRLLAVAGGPSVSPAAAAATLELPETEAEDLCEALVDLSLLESPSPGRYHYHDLLRVFALGRADQDELTAARRRLLDHYLVGARAVLRCTWPGSFLIDQLATAEADFPAFPGPLEAKEWITREFAAVVAVLGAPGTPPRHSVDLLQVLILDTDPGQRGGELVRPLTALAAAAHDDPLVEGRARYLLGYVFWYIGRPDDCAREAMRAMQLVGQTGDLLVRLGLAQANGIRLLAAGDHAAAADCLADLVEVRRSIGDRAGTAWDLANLANALTNLGDYVTAHARVEESIAIVRELGHHSILTYALGERGRVLLRLGHDQAARADLVQAIAMARQTRETYLESRARLALAELHLTAGRDLEALAEAEAAAAYVVDHGTGILRALAVAMLGRALLRVGQDERGLACLRTAHEVFERLGHPMAAEIAAKLGANSRAE
ncbi:AfsR/SARP family transcriptional regulator [Nonomuraea typhae]|uniref:AfsR/SARP family transcriptional regulator n=1 Tax=Nonomuraea typhae TaxID=2603600 RepID=UPI001CA4AAA7|nr:BTAD domain-containing putative transcriptional regulator [Nonomuraea typhae]